MNYIVFRRPAGTFDGYTVWGPFSSFGQALDWIGLGSEWSFDLERNGKVHNEFEYRIQAIYKP